MLKSTGKSIFRWLMVSLFSAFFANVCSFAQITATATPRITQAVVDTQRTTLKNTTRIAKLATADAGALSNGQKLEHLILLLKPSDTQQRALTAFLAQQHDANSANYRKWLTPAEYGERFGVADSDIQAIEEWLQSFGLTVENVSKGKTVIMFSGTHSQFASAFQTTLHTYTVNGQKVIANNADPQIPTAFAPVVKALVSLNSLQAKSAHEGLGEVRLNKKTHGITLLEATNKMLLAKSGTSSNATPEYTFPSGSDYAGYHAVTPQDLATIYNLKKVWAAGITGSGQSIAIIGRSRVRTADVDYFRSTYGLPATKLETILAGDDPGYSDDEGEQALDVEWSGTAAEEATIKLVISASSTTTDGALIAAEYAVDNNVAPIINMSYGLCEAQMGDTNSLYSAMWEQAAAQGQSVFVSTGDSDAATCSTGYAIAFRGPNVNGIASTPYNVAVGGTDFYGDYLSGSSTYWAKTNDSNLSSALSYIPESAWNNSCANPLLFDALVADGYSYSSRQEMCAALAIYQLGYTDLVGGGGGTSSCLSMTGTDYSTCTGAYAKPGWQANVTGIPDNSARNIPDVSLFAANGIFGSFYIYCQSDMTSTGTCDLTNDLDMEAAGGTSFASPIFAGIMALINQKANATQGNPNPVFYKIAADQYSSGLDCSSSTGIPPSSCIFHDITLGGNQVPCYEGTIGCTGPFFPLFGNNTGIGLIDEYASTTGYDRATGLGSVDVNNLVNAWGNENTYLDASTTTLVLNTSSSMTYGTAIAGTVTVASSNNGVSTTPTGDVAIMTTSSSSDGTANTIATLSNGVSSVTLEQLPAGTYSVYASYGGDDVFSVSSSEKQSITINQAASQPVLALSRASVTSGQITAVTVTVPTAGSGVAPTGTITVTNSTTGAVLGTVALEAYGTASSALYDIPSTEMQSGANTLLFAYSGDANYSAATATAAVTFTAPYAISLTSSTMKLGTTAGSSSTTTVSITAANGGTAAWPISLSCTGSLPAGASCNISPVTLSSGVTTAVVTVSYSPVVAANHNTPQPNGKKPYLPASLAADFAGLALLGLFRNRKRWLAILPCIGLLAIILSPIGCGSSSVNHGVGFTLASSSSSVAYGSPVTLTTSLTSLDASYPATGTVAFTDTVNGTTTTLGSVTVANSTASYIVGKPSLGSHSYRAIYSGDLYHSAAQTSLAAVEVSYSNTLTVKATDANGNIVTTPLAVTIQ